MYYVIKRQVDKLPSTFMGFAVEKYIASKANNNVIFFFEKEGKVIRKWVKIEEIILLTEDREYFLTIMKRFKKIEDEQKALVEEAQLNLQTSISNFEESMNSEIDDYEEIRDSEDVPCILKDL